MVVSYKFSLASSDMLTVQNLVKIQVADCALRHLVIHLVVVFEGALALSQLG